MENPHKFVFFRPFFTIKLWKMEFLDKRYPRGGVSPIFIQYKTGVWKCLTSLSRRPQPRYRNSFLEPQMQNFYPVLGWSLALSYQKILAPIRIKSALPPPKKTQNTPPLKGGILWTWSKFPGRETCKKGKGHQNRGPTSLLEPQLSF